MSTSFSASNSGNVGEESGNRVSESTESTSSAGGLFIERQTENREIPANELAESEWPRRVGYEWVAEIPRVTTSKYRWSALLKSWLASVYIFERGADPNTVLVGRTSGIDCVCHGREGAENDFFFMYAALFYKLHVRLPLDDFTMGVLRLLTVTPTQLHLNSWGCL